MIQDQTVYTQSEKASFEICNTCNFEGGIEIGDAITDAGLVAVWRKDDGDWFTGTPGTPTVDSNTHLAKKYYYELKSGASMLTPASSKLFRAKVARMVRKVDRKTAASFTVAYLDFLRATVL